MLIRFDCSKWTNDVAMHSLMQVEGNEILLRDDQNSIQFHSSWTVERISNNKIEGFDEKSSFRIKSNNFYFAKYLNAPTRHWWFISVISCLLMHVSFHIWLSLCKSHLAPNSFVDSVRKTWLVWTKE